MLLTANLLADATSPYLLQHAHNPVHWRQWGPAALAEARERDRPILISIGYAACHWCHVMAHESFENEEIAALMNRLFVNIKVDREERPDIDHIYMTALHALGEQGGWPLTMFLAPDGAPLFGGTYWPPEPRWGRPSFRQILHAVDKAWAEKREALITQGANLKAFFAEQSEVKGGGAIAPADLATIAAAYSVDAEWHVPHFEKMLYDNAQIFELLALAHADAPNPLFAERAEETFGWLMREMRVGGDERFAFAASQDADQAGEEGSYYTWTAPEVDAALGADAAAFKAAYDVRPGGNWEDRNVLRRTLAPHGDAAAEGLLAKSRQTLFALREERSKPGLDDKILADWNGLMIAALARATSFPFASACLYAARRAFAFMDQTLRDGEGRLVHAWRAGRVGAAGMLDDYAAMARAALALFEATGERLYLSRAGALVEEAQDLFGDADGSFFITARDAADVPAARPRHAHDGATPSGIGLLAEVFARLYHLTGETRWQRDGERLIAAFAGPRDALAQSPLLLAAADFMERAAVVVVAGDANNERAKALVSTALASSDPATCVLRTADGADWPAPSPAYGRTPIEGAPAAYFCRGAVCSLPVTTPDALRELMTHP
jgi:uncharacterized protein YyaL (SSP411 family)